jgi:dTDP-glucose 4,6-dehydratase
MRILVTGGFGFIGSAFASLAVGRGHEIVIIDKMTYAADFDNIPEPKYGNTYRYGISNK